MQRITDDHVRAICATHGPQPSAPIRRLRRGNKNETFVVGDLIARFNTNEPDPAKFRTEIIAYQALREAGLPVPDVLAFDDSRTLLPCDCLLLSRAPGTSIAESWSTLRPERARALVEETARALVRIHQLAPPRFGDLHDRGDERWAGWLVAYATRNLTAARQYDLLQRPLSERMERLLEALPGLDAGVARPTLTHGDFHYGNLLQCDGRLTGIVDLEWAVAGDPAWDFSVSPARERQAPGSERWFTAEYARHRPLPAQRERRAAIYRVLRELEFVVVWAREGDPAGARREAAELDRLLTQVDGEP